jgi:hypothetical protein
MAQKKQILLNAFNMNCVGHITHGLWTHPRDRSSDYNTLEHWPGIARTLERGLFDGLFIADIVGVYDLYQHNVDVTLRESIQLPVNDPLLLLLLVLAMAAVTQHLGFGVTGNLTYEQPYLLARRFSTLDHLTRGRNAGTSSLATSTAPRARWAWRNRSRTTSATIGQTNTSRCSTTCGKAAGKTARCGMAHESWADLRICSISARAAADSLAPVLVVSPIWRCMPSIGSARTQRCPASIS